MKLRALAKHLDEYLEVKGFQDSSANGLQFEGREEVQKVALSVDACQEIFRQAIRNDADFLLVHHGLIWGEVRAIRGTFRRRLGHLFSSRISLYASHLPLDAHPEVGNNSQILKALGIEVEGRAGEYKGQSIGFYGELERGEALDEFAPRVEENLGTRCRSLGFGGRVRRVAVVSGGGWQGIYDAEKVGYDTLITGEASHSAYTLAEEMGVNVIFAGHYATERLGPLALGQHLKEKFGLETVFIEHSTGL